MSSKTFGVAIIGSGIFVKEEHLPAVQNNPHFQLKAIYSRSLKSAQALNANVDLYSDDSGSGKSYADLLKRSDIDAVIIALPILTQPEFIEKALSAGKHVLSEKPIAENVKQAEDLIKFYDTKIDKSKVTWGVAENFRFLEALGYAREELSKLGRILSFITRSQSLTGLGGKYIETSWRKNPGHQGGFLLDGGVHTVAAVRRLLGPDDAPTALSSYSALLQKHLPPVDTVNSIWITKSGISGTFTQSYGSTLNVSDHTVAAENGSVVVSGPKVTVYKGQQRDGNVTVKEFPNDKNGVQQEIDAWAKALLEGKPNPAQSPEQALADLEILEQMLRSGEQHGQLKILERQV